MLPTSFRLATLAVVPLLAPMPAPGEAIAQSASPAAIVAPLTDPARPATVKVNVISGGITVRAASRRDVQVEVSQGDEPRDRRVQRRGGSADTTGLRRLTSGASFSVEEENNEVRVSSRTHDADTHFIITVPTRTNLNLSSINGGVILVEGVEGEMEIQNTNDAIVLRSVGGSVVAHAINGGVTATVTRVTPNKAMAFTSLNGDVDVTLPVATKAALKLRSDQGEVFTDFEMQVRTDPPAVQETRRSGGRFRIEVSRAISGTINGGGPDVELRSFNGSVYLRRGAQ